MGPPVGTSVYDDARSVAVTKTGTVYVAGYTDGDIDGMGPGAPLGLGDLYLMRMDRLNSDPSFRQFGTHAFEAWPRVVLTSSGVPIVSGLTAGTLFGHQNVGSLDVFLTEFSAS